MSAAGRAGVVAVVSICGVVVVGAGAGCSVAIACAADGDCPDDVPVCIDGFCGVGSGAEGEAAEEGEGEEGEGDLPADGDGSCAAPLPRALPFAIVDDGAAGPDDVIAIGCAEAADIDEFVFIVDVPVGVDLLVSGSDESGQGIGFQVREGSCTGAVRGCVWRSNGILDDERVISDGGPAVFIVERAPRGGPFSFSIRIDE